MNEVAQFLDSVSGPKYNTGLGLVNPVTVAPIVGLNGYQQQQSGAGTPSSQSTPSSNSSSSASAAQPASSGSLFSSPQLSLNGGSTQFDANSGTSFTNSGNTPNTGIGSLVSGLGMLGNITHDSTISQAAGLAGAGYGAMNGNYTGLGGYIGGALSNSPYGALAGSLFGNFMSPDTSTAKFAANAALGLGMPGYGALNALSAGWLGNSLFGTDAQKNAAGQTTIAATPGLLGNLGWNNNNANTTQQDMRASEIAAQSAGYGSGGGGGFGGKTGGTGEGSNGNAGNGRD